MTSSVDGLISGLNTTQLISQLMQVEAQPQTLLKNKISNEHKVITAYQAVNTRLAALQTAAESLTKAATWQAVKATSSSDAVVATAAAGAAAGDTTFDVTRLATAHIVTLAASDLGAMTTGGGLDISVGGAAPTHLAVATDTPAGVAAAINGSSLGVRASVIATDQGIVLQLTATRTGSAAAFTVDGFAATSNVVVPGQNAQITFGIPPAGYTASSATNTFTSVVSGVTFTATRVQAGVTISVVADSAKLANAMQSFVDLTAAALTEIETQTKYDPAAKAGSPLTGNSTIRRLQQDLLSGISNGQAGYGSFNQLGISLDQNGKPVFDRAAFLAAYQADPATVQAAVATGVASQLQVVTKRATDPTNGAITLAVQGRNDSVRTLTDQVDGWDIRLEGRQHALQLQYAGLEVALSKLKNQSSWLSGQIASLPTSSGQ
jgi:flagellar hook-associated protein 2